MAETKWDAAEGWDLHVGAFLAINENSRFDFTYFRQSRNGAIAQEFNTKMYQLRFGYSRRILAGESISLAK